MIDTYGERNPCTFCEEDDGKASENKEYLEFSLCGKNASLFVREVSVDNLTKPKEDVPESEDANTVTEPSTTKSTPNLVPSRTSAKHNRGSNQIRNSHTKRLDALYTKKWSGHTYFEEEIRRLRDLQYDKDVREALKMRRLWHSFQIQILRDRRRELLKSSGPEWWQEPSRKQIVLATTLRDVVKADFEEEVTGRTRQWLLDLGVTTRLTPKQVRRCMKLSLLQPVDFLLEIHKQVVKAQQSKKKKGDLQRPFSVDERLLLSALCVLQLPPLLTMLHFMFPPPRPIPENKHFKELLYGDLEDETIRYSSPYMEPLPFRNKIDFEDWAFGKICSALLPILVKNFATEASINKCDFSEKMTSELKRSLSCGSLIPPIENNRLSVYSTAPSIALLLSYCLSKRTNTDSMKVNLDDESVGRRKDFVRRLTLLGKAQFKTTESSKGEPSETPVEPLSTKSFESMSTLIRENPPSVLEKEKSQTQPAQEPYDEYNRPNQPGQGYNPQPMTVKDNVNPYYDPQYYGNYDEQTNYYDNRSVREDQMLSKKKTGDTELSKTPSKLTLEAMQSVSGDHVKSVRKEREGSIHQLQSIWDEIAACPEKEQLHKAITILMEMGDPLAQLPGIEKLPAIQRWVEMRRGKNRILKKETKIELLNVSRGMWKSMHCGNMNRGPHVEMSKAEERKLTWDKKKWLQSQIKKEKQDYFTRIRQEKVDNARLFFPTMLNHYDYGSKLNRNFRDIYFTYLPAREADLLAYRPWQPQETRISKT